MPSVRATPSTSPAPLGGRRPQPHPAGEPVDAEALHTFKLLDLDRNGTLDPSELENVLKGL